MASAPDTIAAAMRFGGLHPVDARLLLQRALGLTHAQLVARSNQPLSDSERAQFLPLAERRLGGEPIAYILGEREFYGRSFAVDRAVLIPRPESELVVDLALARLPEDAASRILDLGTGSGNLAITLALERPCSRVDAVDASAAALRVARANARTLGADNVRFLEGLWYQPVSGERYDLIVGNPPYVAEGDPLLGVGDLRFEPRTALAAGPEGLDALCSLVPAAAHHLVAGGWLILEHGHDQADAVARLLDAAGFEACFAAHDLAYLPRVSGGRKSSRPGHRLPEPRT